MDVHGELEDLYRFRDTSTLKNYIIHKRPTWNIIFLLKDLLLLVRDIIRDEGLFDNNNPAIIMCDTALEQALNMKALHVTQIRAIIVSNLLHVEHRAVLPRMEPIPPETFDTPTTSTAVQLSTCSRKNKTNGSNTSRIGQLYVIKQRFYHLLATVPDFDRRITYFTYDQITTVFAKYMLRRLPDFLDRRNILTAIIKDDELRNVFGVNAFHRNQVNYYINQHITPIFQSNNESRR